MIHDPRGNQLQFASQRVSSITVLFQTAKELSCNVFRVLNALYTCSSNVTMLKTSGLTLLNYTVYLAVK